MIHNYDDNETPSEDVDDEHPECAACGLPLEYAAMGTAFTTRGVMHVECLKKKEKQS